MTLIQLAQVLEAAASKARELAEQDSADRRDWIEQTGSPLGPRRHHNAVKQRIASGRAGAAKVGRRSLLSPEALAEELNALSDGSSPKAGARVTPESGPQALAVALKRFG